MMLQLDLFDFHHKEHQRETRKVNRTAWMVQDALVPPALSKRIRQRVRR